MAQWLQDEKALVDELLSYNDSDMRHRCAIENLWERSTALLAEEELGVLQTLSYFAPEPIPEFLQEEVENGSKIVRKLARLSLLKRIPGSEEEPAAVFVHQLLHEATRRELQGEEHAEQRAAAVSAGIGWIAAKLPHEIYEYNDWAAWDPIIPHGLVICEHAEPEGGDRDLPWLLSFLGGLLRGRAQFAEAEPLMRRALEIGEDSYGAEHPRVAIELNNLALLLQTTNRMDEAEPLMRRALEIDEASFGAETLMWRAI